MPSPSTRPTPSVPGSSSEPSPGSRSADAAPRSGGGRPAALDGRAKLIGAVAATVAAGALAIAAAQWLVGWDPVREFVAAYPGAYAPPDWAPVGIPAWLGWQHFFNAFFMAMLARVGWQIRNERRPPGSWTPRWPKKARRMTLTVWAHLALDTAWVANGAIFVVLLFATGQWARIVPTSWEVFPNALSAALQYASLDWPTHDGWAGYNALQQLGYFVTVFVAAPLAIASGFRLSYLWPRHRKRLGARFPAEWARAVHFPVMLYFCVFTVVHVALVLSTGALRNLNRMYAAQDAVNWTGFWAFLVSLGIIAAGVLAARPLVLAPIASLFGEVRRL